MKKTLLTVTAIAILALPSACQNIQQTIQNLKSSDANVRRQAIDNMAQFGAEAIPALLSTIETAQAQEEPGTTMAAKNALERVVYHSTRPGASTEKRTVEKALLARLQKPAPESLQRFLLRLITVVGTSQSVPTLEKLLSDKNLREPARMALQQIPGNEATVVLERAFSQASEPQWKSALLMAIGARKQARSAKLVLSALKSSQPEVRMMAILVAGEFATPEIRKVLQQIAQKGSEREKEAAQHSLARIAERLSRAKREVPHAYGVVEADVTELVRWFEAHRESFQRQHGVRLTYTALFARAAVEALRAFPVVNAQWAEDAIVLKPHVNLGIAVSVEDGLVVPVIHRAEEKSLVGLARELEDITRRAREGKLTLEDVQGGTFTLTNPGVFGSVWSLPIINYPQAAILATDAIAKRPVVRDDAIAIRSILHLGLSFDHRVFDGAVAVQFLNHVKASLEAVDPVTR